MGLLHLNADHLLIGGTCTWYRNTGVTTSATTGGKTPAFAAGVDLACNQKSPSRRWRLSWPETALESAIQFNLPDLASAYPAAYRPVAGDRITFESVTYNVIDVAATTGIGRGVLCQVSDRTM